MQQIQLYVPETNEYVTQNKHRSEVEFSAVPMALTARPSPTDPKQYQIVNAAETHVLSHDLNAQKVKWMSINHPLLNHATKDTWWTLPDTSTRTPLQTSQGHVFSNASVEVHQLNAPHVTTTTATPDNWWLWLLLIVICTLLLFFFIFMLVGYANGYRWMRLTDVFVKPDD